MGLGPRLSTGTSDVAPSVPRPTGNPNPYHFRVNRAVEVGHIFVCEVVYPDCKNFEGVKIIVSTENPEACETFDPHFEEGGYVIARFAPTTVGWSQAMGFARAIT